MRLSTLLSKHLTDAANIQESNSVNYFNLCGNDLDGTNFRRDPCNI
jgi:hypothetical protein